APLASTRRGRPGVLASRRAGRTARLTAVYVVLIVGMVFVSIPFIWMLSTSFKDEATVFLSPPRWIPRPLHPENYVQAMTVLPFAVFFRNTLITTLVPLVGALASCSLVAYSFARLRWPGRDICFLIVLATLMLPEQV